VCYKSVQQILLTTRARTSPTRPQWRVVSRPEASALTTKGHTMTVTIHVDASRTFDTDLPDATAGEWADQLASEHAVIGTEFSFKADGVVLDRVAQLDDLDDGTLLELIEVTVPAGDGSDDDSGDENPDGALVVPDGNVDEEAWVADGTDGARQRAQAALDAEQASDKPRITLVDALTKLLPTDE